jgi:hypothetical protein
MTDDIRLSGEERIEIERRVADYRATITNAAIRRRREALSPRGQANARRKQARELLAQPATQIRLLQRLLAGEGFAAIAPEFHHSAGYLRSFVCDVVLEQMEYPDREADRTTRIGQLSRSFDNHDSEWFCCLTASHADYYKIWMPLALQRLQAAGS